MSDPFKHVLEHALVPVAFGRINSDGRDLITGEIVERFWQWPKHIQDMHLADRNVVMVSQENARKSMEKVAEIRGAAKLKEEKAEIKGAEAQLEGVRKLIEDLDVQRGDLVKKADALMAELKKKDKEIAAKLKDASVRPPDDESAALEPKPEDDIKDATGLDLTEEPEERDEEVEEDVDDDSGEDPHEDITKEVDVPVVSDSEIAQIKEWADKAPYKEMQKVAKGLGISSFGKKAAELKVIVADAIIDKEMEKRKKAAEQADE